MKVGTIISDLSGRQVDAFYVLLVTSGNYTFLPELYDIFGRDATLKFLEVFAGCSLSVPKVEKLEKLARNAAIYLRIEQASLKQQPSIVESLSEEYNLTESQVRRVFAKTKVKLEDEYGFKVVRRGSL